MTLRTVLVLFLIVFPPIQSNKALPITIEVQRNVDVRHNTQPYESKGVLYLYEPTAKDFRLKKGQRFQMVETLSEGGCRIRFKGKLFAITSCPWLGGFTDHQENVFCIVTPK
jgi:hypothetical protein